MAIGKLFIALVLISAGLQARAAASLDDVLNGYRDVASALSKDNFSDAALQAGKLTVVSQDLVAVGGALAPYYKKIAFGAKAMAASTKETELRSEMSALSEGAVNLVKLTPAIQAKWQLYKCPMVVGAFGFWIQPVGDRMANPYMGSEMLQCGTRKTWAKFP